MNGWNVRVLRVDLSQETVTREDLDPQVVQDYIGGRGFGIYYMNRKVDRIILVNGRRVDEHTPLSAEDTVVFLSPIFGG